ncbi:hypothetical protein [Curtobacterium sp. MCPF17_011]|uniref:hypothetical protein n=1 Tax=Curtobacterium sp. MCPF17_011 TaxID=2175652 RepID=UPI0035C92FC1
MQAVQAVQDGIVNAYADSLSPVFWYLLPFIAAALVLALFIPQLRLADVAGMVARGEAVGGDEADALERARRDGAVRGDVPAGSEPESPERVGSQTGSVSTTRHDE